MLCVPSARVEVLQEAVPLEASRPEQSVAPSLVKVTLPERPVSSLVTVAVKMTVAPTTLGLALEVTTAEVGLTSSTWPSMAMVGVTFVAFEGSETEP